MDATAEQISELTGVMRDLLTTQQQTNRLLRRQLEPPSPWLSGDEAAELLGKRVVKSREHLRALSYARDKGWLRTFASRSPYRYLRQEVEDLLTDIKRGNKVLP